MQSSDMPRQNSANEHFMIAYQIVWGSIVACLALRNLIFFFLHRQREKAIPAQTAQSGEIETEKADVLTTSHRWDGWRRLESWALHPLFRKSGWQSVTPFKLMILVTILSINLGFLLAISTDVRPPFNMYLNTPHAVAIRAGAMGLAQAPPLIAFTGRNNIVQLLTGISYQDLRFVHKSLGVTWILFALVHFLGMIFSNLAWSGPMSVKALYSLDIAKFGILALIGLVVFQGLFSLPVVRRHQYEMFLIAHLVGAISVLVGAYHHVPELRPYVYAAISFWAFDRTLRLVQTFTFNPFSLSPTLHKPLLKANATYSHGAIILRVPFPNGEWKAGQHAYISFCDKKGLRHPSLLGQHPFSIANVPTMDSGMQEMLFVIREREGMTNALARTIRDTDDQGTLNVVVEGPYGRGRSPHLFHEVLFVAGGSGITHIMSMLADLMHKAKLAATKERAVKSRTVKAKLLWVVQRIDQASWLLDELTATVQRAQFANVELHISIFVTRGPTSSPLNASREYLLNEKNAPVTSSERSPSESSTTFEPSSPQTDYHRRKDSVVSATTSFGGSMISSELGHVLSKASVKSGRPDLKALTKEFVEEACGESLVAACGPSAIVEDVRTEVAKLIPTHRVTLDIASYEC